MIRAIILCGGKATRLGEVAAGKPKCMLRVGGYTWLDRQVMSLPYHGGEVLLCTGVGDEHVCAWESVRLPDGREPLGTAGALRNAANKCEHLCERVIVMHGDVLNSPAVYETLLAMMLESDDGSMLLRRQEWPNARITGGMVVYQPVAKTSGDGKATHQDCGIYGFWRRTLERLPERGDLSEVLPSLNMRAVLTNAAHYEIGSLEGLAHARECLR